MATEIEMKLRAPSVEVLEQAMASPELNQFIRDDFVTVHMKSIYLDTPAGTLRKKKWTLRLREEDSYRIVAMKTVSEKTADGMFTRDEWRCLCDSPEDAVDLLVDQGAPKELKKILQGQTLVPVCIAEFDRRSCYLYLPDGVCIELAGDVGYLSAGDQKKPITELELELLYGSASALPPLCAHLEEDFGLAGETRSKYERALALLNNEPTEEPA